MKKTMFRRIGLLVAMLLTVFHVKAGNEADCAYPHCTARTCLLTVPEYYSVLQPKDGYFGVQIRDSISFYSVYDGAQVKGWKLKPLDGGSFFDEGSVVVMEYTKEFGKKVYLVVHEDGSVVKLPANWKNVTNFVDGIAGVQAGGGGQPFFFFYINAWGQRVFPELMVTARQNFGYYNQLDKVQPLCDGMRAFYHPILRKWGFVDGKGHIVIKPQFEGTRAFRDGYAMVTLQDRTIAFIDKKGNVSFKTNLTGYSLDTEFRVSDAIGGIVRVYDGNGTTYYDVHGKVLHKFDGCCGTPVVKNRIFLENDSRKIVMMDTNFRILRELETGNWDFSASKPAFSDEGYAIVDDNEAVVNAEGKKILGIKEWSADEEWIAGTYRERVGEDGIVPIRFHYKDNSYDGFCNLKGEFTVIVGEEGKDHSGILELIKKEQDLLGCDSDSLQKKKFVIVKWPRKNHRYKIAPKDTTVVIVDIWPPVDSTKTIGEGKDSIPQNIRQTKKRQLPGFRLPTDSINQYPENTHQQEGQRQQNVKKKQQEQVDDPQPWDDTGKLVAKKYKEQNVPTIALKGTMNYRYVDTNGNYVAEPIPAYMEIAKGGKMMQTPYGEARGFLKLCFPADKVFVAKSENSSQVDEYRVFHAPFRIVDIFEENGKYYLKMDGGAMHPVGLLLDKNNQANNMGQSAVKGFAALLSFAPPTFSTDIYRVEMLDYNKQTGSFTFGKMEVFGVDKNGAEQWVPVLSIDKVGQWIAGVRRIKTKIVTWMPQLKQKSYKDNPLEGVRMEASGKDSEIGWFYPKQWCPGDEGEKYLEYVNPEIQKRYLKYKPKTRSL